MSDEQRNMDYRDDPRLNPQPIDDEEQAKGLFRREIRRLGWGMSAFIVVCNAAVRGIYYLLCLITGDAGLMVPFQWAMVMEAVAIYGIGLPVMYWIIRGCGTYDIENRHTVPSTPGILPAIFCICYAAMILSNLLTLNIIDLISTTRDVGENRIAGMMDTGSLLAAFYIVAVAPVLEELVFRKILLERLRKYGDRFCILVTALMFALFHMNIYQILYAFVLGVVFAYLVIRYGKLWYTMVLHIAINGMGMLAATVTISQNESGIAFLGLLVLGIIIAGIVCLIKYRWKIYMQRSDDILVRLKKPGLYIRNSGTLSYILLTVALTVMLMK